MVERQKQILDILSRYGYISVHKLAKILCVSEPTARREIAVMEKNALVRRTYGGVMKAMEFDYIPIDVRDTIDKKNKRIIAEKASKLIKGGMVIFIDSSSTAKCLLEFLHEDMNITVVTNSYDLCEKLAKSHIKSFCSGGYIDAADHAMRGPFAIEFIQHFRFDIAFFSCSALSSDGMLCGASIEGVSFIRALLPHSSHKVLLCSSEKFGKEKAYLICSVDEIDEIISDKELPDNIQSLIKKNSGFN